VASPSPSQVPSTRILRAKAGLSACSREIDLLRRTRWRREPDSNLRFRVRVTVSRLPSERAAKPPRLVRGAPRRS